MRLAAALNGFRLIMPAYRNLHPCSNSVSSKKVQMLHICYIYQMLHICNKYSKLVYCDPIIAVQSNVSILHFAFCILQFIPVERCLFYIVFLMHLHNHILIVLRLGP